MPVTSAEGGWWFEKGLVLCVALVPQWNAKVELDRDGAMDSIYCTWCHSIEVSVQAAWMEPHSLLGVGQNSERNRQNSILGGTRYHRDRILIVFYYYFIF